MLAHRGAVAYCTQHRESHTKHDAHALLLPAFSCCRARRGLEESASLRRLVSATRVGSGGAPGSGATSPIPEDAAVSPEPEPPTSLFPAIAARLMNSLLQMSHAAVCSATRAVAALAEARARALADPRALQGADPARMRQVCGNPCRAAGLLQLLPWPLIYCCCTAALALQQPPALPAPLRLPTPMPFVKKMPTMPSMHWLAVPDWWP